MSKIALFRRYSLLIYFILAFVISWGAIILIAGPGGIPIDPEQSEEIMPFIYMAMLLGPSVGGVMMVLLADGKSGFREMISRLVKWRTGVHWFAVVLLATPMLASLILLVLSLVSPEFLPAIFKSGEGDNLLLTGIAMGIMVGFFEELGWTGFAVPRLRKRFNILYTGLIIGILWGLWHFLVFWERNSFAEALPLAIMLSRLLSWLPPFRVLMVWIHDRTGSLLLTILMHASLVATTLGIVPMTLAGGQLLTWLLVWGALLWIAVVLIAVASGGRLTVNRNE